MISGTVNDALRTSHACLGVRFFIFITQRLSSTSAQ